MRQHAIVLIRWKFNMPQQRELCPVPHCCRRAWRYSWTWEAPLSLPLSTLRLLDDTNGVSYNVAINSRCRQKLVIKGKKSQCYLPLTNANTRHESKQVRYETSHINLLRTGIFPLTPLRHCPRSSKLRFYRSRNDEYTSRNILFSNSWTKSLREVSDLAN